MIKSEQQEKFLWLAFAEKKTYPEIASLLSVSRADLTKWTSDFKKEWEIISKIRALYDRKKMTLDFKTFYENYLSKEKDKRCCYCEITEHELAALIDSKKISTKRLLTRGRKLELDRKDPNKCYDDLDNIVFACYWCNNAKTDTFSHDEFLRVGKVFAQIWKERSNL